MKVKSIRYLILFALCFAIIIEICGCGSSSEEEVVEEPVIEEEKIEEYEFEADELGMIMNTDAEKKYYDKILHVHGWLYRHPTEEGIYTLYNPNVEGLGGESKGVIFTCDSLNADIGDGSELIITGTLNYNEETTVTTILLGTDLEVIDKEEPVYEIGSVEELYGEKKYMNQKVTVSGDVNIGDVGGPLKMYGEYSGVEVYLIGTYETDMPDNSYLTVTGTVREDEYGQIVIDVEEFY